MLLMNMEIVKAAPEDVEAIEKIYSDARLFMKKSGNLNQWVGNYPSREIIEGDIKENNLYVVKKNSEILAVFFFKTGEDETYIKIFDGEWLNDRPYGVIHRIAVSDTAHGMGVAKFCFEYCFGMISNIKIDTHRDNIPMQKSLVKNGFKRCGIIYLKNGDERIAFQRG